MVCFLHFREMLLFRRTSYLLSFAFSISAIDAATFTWDGGGANNNTSNAPNWSPNVAPPHGGVPGSNTTDWRFVGSQRTTPFLDDDVALRDLTFDSSSGFQLFSSREITLNGTIANLGSGQASVSADVALNAAGYLEARGGDLTFSGDVHTNNRDLTLFADSGKSLYLNGVLKGGYLPQFGGLGIKKTGPGTLDLGGLNTYSTPIDVTAGSMRLLTTGALSSNSSASLVVGADASVVVNNGLTLPNHAVELSGTMEFVGTSGWSFTNGLNLSGEDARILASGSLGTLTGSSDIQTHGDTLLFEAESGATLRLNSDFDFDPAGGEGVLLIGQSGGGTGVVEINGSVSQASGSLGSLLALSVRSGNLELNSAVVSDFSNFVVNSPGSVDVGEGNLLVRNLAGTGDISIGSNGLIVDNSDSTFFSGDVLGSGSSTFEKTGSGMLTVTGTIDGFVNRISAGTLELQDAKLNGSLNRETLVRFGGVLTGTGAADYLRVSNSGILRPGTFNSGSLAVDQIFLENDGIIEWSPLSWAGDPGAGWPQVSASLVNCDATSSNPFVIRIDTGHVSDFTDGTAAFVIVRGSITGFDASEFEVVDVSGAPLPGTWSVSDDVFPGGLAVVFTPDDPYGAWIEGFDLSGPDTLPEADPDQDGLENGVEFVVGSSPDDDASANFPELSVVEIEGEEYLNFAFNRTLKSSYLDPMGEISANLLTWEDFDGAPGYFATGTEIDGSTTRVEQLIPFDPIAYPSRFVRLRVDFVAEP